MNFKRNRQCYKSALKECKSLQAWDKQNKLKLGFIPLGDLKLPKFDSPSIHEKLTPIEMHSKVKSTGTFNFLQAQLVVKSQLNVHIWQKYLTDYWDKRFPYLILHSFPLDFDTNSPLNHELKNRNSAITFPQDIKAYISEESIIVLS